MITRTPPETPAPALGPLMTGHYDMKSDYATWRSQGTGDWLLFCTLSGAGRFGRGPGRLRTSSNELVLIRPHTPHDYGMYEDGGSWNFLWAHFIPRPHWLEVLSWPESRPGIFKLELATELFEAIAAAMRKMHRLALGPELRREMLAMNALEEALLLADMGNPNVEHLALDGRVRRAIEHICAEISSPISIDDLAAVAGLSPSRFAHLFHDQVGQTPREYVEGRRMDRARQLLACSQLTIRSIAQTVGYSSPFYFSRRFHAMMGMSPSAYREAANQDRAGVSEQSRMSVSLPASTE